MDRRLAPSAAVLCAALFFPASLAFAQNGAFLEVSGEISPVTIGTVASTWRVARLAGGVYEEGRFGWTVAGERHERRDLVDWAYQAGGFRRAGEWTFIGSLGYGHSPTFLYRRSLEGEIARRLIGGLVVHGAYRHLTFSEVTVHVAQPAVSWYFARGDLQARAFLVNDATTDRRSSTILLRASVTASPRLRLSAGVAGGTRIFDVAALSVDDGDAWVAFGAVRLLVTPRVSVDVGVGAAEEDPLFSQRTVSVGARWTF